MKYKVEHSGKLKREFVITTIKFPKGFDRSRWEMLRPMFWQTGTAPSSTKYDAKKNEAYLDTPVFSAGEEHIIRCNIDKVLKSFFGGK